MSGIPAGTLTTTSGSYVGVWTPVSGGTISTRTAYQNVILDRQSHALSGSRIPNFRKRLAAGEFLPPQSYHRTDERISNCYVGAVVATSSFSNGTRYGGYVSTWDHLPVSTEVLYRCLATLTRQLDRVDQADLMNLAVSHLDKNTNVGPLLAQIGQTRKMILNALGSLIKFSTNALRIMASHGLRVSVKEAMDYAIRSLTKGNGKGIADVYLELIYGWRPLVSDIENIYKQLDRMYHEADKLPKLLRGSADTAEVASLTGSLVFVSESQRFSGQGYQWVLDSSGTVGNGCRALAYARPLVDKSRFAINPISTAWDVVPFSFVVDWVINISTMLRAFETSLGLDMLGGSLGTSLTIDMIARPRGVITGAPNGLPTGERLEHVTLTGHISMQVTTLIRRPVSPKASLPKLIRLEGFLSHLPETLALLVQQLPRKGRSSNGG